MHKILLKMTLNRNYLGGKVKFGGGAVAFLLPPSYDPALLVPESRRATKILLKEEVELEIINCVLTNMLHCGVFREVWCHGPL